MFCRWNVVEFLEWEIKEVMSLNIVDSRTTLPLFANCYARRKRDKIWDILMEQVLNQRQEFVQNAEKNFQIRMNSFLMQIKRLDD